LMPAISALIAFPLSRWIADLRFISGFGFFFGMALVTIPLLVMSLIAGAGTTVSAMAIPRRDGRALSVSGERPARGNRSGSPPLARGDSDTGAAVH
jgi:hypothetical protein